MCMLLSFLDKLNEWVEPFKDWIYEHHNNPFLWLGLFLIGLAIFGMTYSALHKDR